MTLIFAMLFPTLALSSVITPEGHAPAVPASLAARSPQVWTWSARESKFSTLPHAMARINCEASNPPQALTTPNPLLDASDQSARITVSFIVGTDGRVHSPLILESAGPPEDRTVLNTVRYWRYRPATCNGVPTEAEAKVEFLKK